MVMIDYNLLAAEYAQHRKVNAEVLKHLIEAGRIKASSRILEVGCGTGNYISAIQKYTRCQAAGCDPSREMLAQASQNSQAVRYQEGRGESLPYPDDWYSTISII